MTGYKFSPTPISLSLLYLISSPHPTMPFPIIISNTHNTSTQTFMGLIIEVEETTVVRAVGALHGTPPPVNTTDSMSTTTRQPSPQEVMSVPSSNSASPPPPKRPKVMPKLKKLTKEAKAKGKARAKSTSQSKESTPDQLVASTSKDAAFPKAQAESSKADERKRYKAEWARKKRAEKKGQE